MFQNTCMDSRRAVLELKDVPPPPPHTSSSQSSQPFPMPPLPMPPLPMPPPCLPPSLTQDSLQQPPQSQLQQEGASPQVSIYSHCDYCSTDGCGLSGGGSVDTSSSSIAGVVSLYMAPGSLGAPIRTSSISSSGICSVASSVHQYEHISCRSGGEVLDSFPSLGYQPPLSSSVATSQPISSQPYLSCCSGLLHTYPAVPLPCSQPGPFPSSALLASPLPCGSSLPAPLHGACLSSSGYYTCGVNCCPSARRSQRTTFGDRTTVTTTTTSTHFCSNPMHLNVERTVCVKGAHYCQECLLKVGRVHFNNCGLSLYFCTLKITVSNFILYGWMTPPYWYCVCGVVICI